MRIPNPKALSLKETPALRSGRFSSQACSVMCVEIQEI
jgi:hypothetical protein